MRKYYQVRTVVHEYVNVWAESEEEAEAIACDNPPEPPQYLDVVERTACEITAPEGMRDPLEERVQS